ncbi:OB-fold nucleic acid binding domain-containing protein, partial [Nitrospirillum viridazoti]
MRPPVLYPLFAPITSLPGLGPRLGKLAERLTGPHVADILWHLPTGILDRANAPSIAEAPEGRIVTLTVRVDGHMPPVQRHRPYRVRCTDHTGEMELVFFHVKGDWLEKKLPQGSMVVVSGKVERFNGLLQMPHPDHFAPVEEGAPPQEVEAVYPLTGGLNPKPLRTAIQAALARAPELEEWQDPAWLERQGWPAWKTAL